MKTILWWLVVAVVVMSCGQAWGQSKSLTLLEPNVGESWSAGSWHWVRWKSSGVSADTTIEVKFTVDGGRNWVAIGSAKCKDQRVLWQVPDRVSKTCKIMISGGAGAMSDSSKGDFSVTASQAGNYKWVEMTGKAAFAPRDGAGLLAYRNKMWLLGGWNPGDKVNFPRICNNEVWSSSDGATWELVKPNTFIDDSFDTKADWEGRHTAGYAVFKERMWIIGGDANQGHYQNDVWCSTNGKTWTCVNDSVPWAPRVLHYTVVFRNKLWIMGGQTLPQFAKADEVFYSDVWNSADGVTWTKVADTVPWAPRGLIGGSIVMNDRIWVVGGGTYNTPQTPKRRCYNDVWSSADGETWRCEQKAAPWNPREYHEVAVFDGKMWVMEGSDRPVNPKGGNRNDVWYSSDGVNWYELPDTPWKPRHAASVCVYDDALWMVAGNNMESDSWKLIRKDK